MVIKRRKNVVLSGTEMNEIFMDAKNDARNFAIQFIYIFFFLLKKITINKKFHYNYNLNVINSIGLIFINILI